MEHIEHTFGPGETIRGIIRKLNGQKLNDEMLDKVLAEFDKINEPKVPRIGDTFKIPIVNISTLPPIISRKKLVSKPRLVFNNPNPPPKKETLDTEDFEVENFTLEGSRIETLDEENNYDEQADIEAMELRQKRREAQRKKHKIKVVSVEPLKKSVPPKPPVNSKPKKEEPLQKKTAVPQKRVTSFTKKEDPIIKKEEPIGCKQPRTNKRTTAPTPEPVKREKKRLVNTTSIIKHRRR